MHFRLLRMSAGVALALAALMPVRMTARQQQDLPIIRFAKDPDPAPGFTIKDLDGQELKLEAYHGKVVLLNFWATWCGPCRAEIPSLIELQKMYGDHLQIIGMVVDEDDEQFVKKFVASQGINYRVALSTSEIRRAYGGVGALPTMFLINEDGRIVQKHVGLFNPVLYETEIRSLAGLPVAARVETFVDDGEIFLKHADRATMLPGVDMTKLSPEQKAAALHKFNAESCTCGCQMTLAQCRIYDAGCKTSRDRCAAIVKEVSGATPTKEAPGETAPAAPATPPTQQ